MPVVNIATVRTRVINLLLANRLAPNTDAVGGNSRYPTLGEFTTTILEVDAMIVGARIATPGDPYRTGFIASSANLAHGDRVPGHTGAKGDIDVAIGATFAPARYAKSRAEVIALKEHPLLYPNSQRWAFIEDSRVFHNGDAARVYYPVFTKTAACQAPEEDELAEVAGTLGFMPKDGAVSPEIYDRGAQYFMWYIDKQIKGKNTIVTEIEQIERQLAA